MHSFCAFGVYSICHSYLIHTHAANDLSARKGCLWRRRNHLTHLSWKHRIFNEKEKHKYRENLKKGSLLTFDSKYLFVWPKKVQERKQNVGHARCNKNTFFSLIYDRFLSLRLMHSHCIHLQSLLSVVSVENNTTKGVTIICPKQRDLCLRKRSIEETHREKRKNDAYRRKKKKIAYDKKDNKICTKMFKTKHTL